MSLLGRTAPKSVEQPTPDRCDACGHAGELAAQVLEGVQVKACRDFRACCARAKASGMWLL